MDFCIKLFYILRDKTALIKKKKSELLRTDLMALCKELVKRWFAKLIWFLIFVQVSCARQGEELLPPHVGDPGVRRLYQPEGAVRGATARHPELAERQGRLCPSH